MLLHLGENLAQNVMSLVVYLQSSSLDINTVYLFIYFMVYATFRLQNPLLQILKIASEELIVK